MARICVPRSGRFVAAAAEEDESSIESDCPIICDLESENRFVNLLFKQTGEERNFPGVVFAFRTLLFLWSNFGHKAKLIIFLWWNEENASHNSFVGGGGGGV